MAMLKGKGVLENLCLLSLALLALAAQSQQQSFGSACGPNAHCLMNKGLICHETLKTCQCAPNNPKASPKYLMEWDPQAAECVAMENGACIGTSTNPVDGDTLKKVRCAGDLVCRQVETMPAGVGVCTNKILAEGIAFGSPCGPNDHCAINKGLICHQGTCQCGNGSLSNSLVYKMIWDTEVDKCLALETGVCVGNENNPVDDETLKMVECQGDLVCKQVDDKPAGIGVCTRQGGETSPPPSSTVADGSSTEGGNNSGSNKIGMGLVTTNVFLIVLSIFVQHH